jgi:hypothetical protein
MALATATFASNIISSTMELVSSVCTSRHVQAAGAGRRDQQVKGQAAISASSLSSTNCAVSNWHLHKQARASSRCRQLKQQ